MLGESLADGHSVARIFHPAKVKITVLESPKRFQNEFPIKAQHLCGLTRREVLSRVLKHGQFETSRHVALLVFFLRYKMLSICLQLTSYCLLTKSSPLYYFLIYIKQPCILWLVVQIFMRQAGLFKVFFFTLVPLK